MQMNTLGVRVVVGPVDLRRVGEFRYRIHVAEKGEPAADAQNADRTLIDPADRRANSTIFWVEEDGEIVGTVRAEIFSPPYELAPEYLKLETFDFAEPPKIVYLSRLMVAPGPLGTRITPALCFTGFQLGLVKDCRLGVLTCTSEWVELFESYGYAAYGNRFLHAECGWKVPMAILGEAAYVQPYTPSLATWLARHRPDSRYLDQFRHRVAHFRDETSRLRACAEEPLARSR
jgi:hypothetical protein